MGQNTYKAVISAETKGFTEAMDRMERSVAGAASSIERRMTEASERGFGRMERSISRVTTALGAYVSFRALEGVGKAAVEQERALGELASTYQSLGIYSDDLMSRTISLAGAIQREANQADEATESNIALMANIGKLSAGQIEPATKAALGLAEAYGLDVRTAFNLVGRAAAGQTQTLSRYGIVLQEGASEQERFNQLLEVGASGYEQLTARVRDSGGSWERLKLYLDDSKEALGAFAASPVILRGVEQLTENIETLTGYVSNLGLTAELVGVKMQKGFVRASGFLTGAQLASGQIPGAVRAGLTPEKIQQSTEQQLAQLDRYALTLVNEWEEKQNARMRNLGNRPVSVRTDLDETAGSGTGKKKGNPYLDAFNRERGLEYARSMAAQPNDYGDKYLSDARQKQAELDAAAADGLRELNDLEYRLGEERIRNRASGFEREIALAEYAYDRERAAMTGKYGEGSEQVRALEAFHAEEMIGMNADMADRMAEDSLRMATAWGDMLYGMIERSDYSFGKIAASFADMVTGMAVKGAIVGGISLLTGGSFGAGFLSALPHFEGGGTVYRPTLAWLGENGKERVLNAAETRAYESGKTGGDTFNLTLQVSAAEKREMMVESDAALGRRIIRLARDNRAVREALKS